MLVLCKNKLVRHILISKNGDTRTDRVKLPASALVVTGVKAYARLISLSVNDPSIVGMHYYYGALVRPTLTAEEVAALIQGTYTDLEPTFNVNSSNGEYVYYAHPTVLSDPIFMYNGFQGGFLDRGTVNVQTPNGVLPHRVWRTTNPNLGNGVVIQAIH